jgi:hypothetical protein
MLRSNRTDGSPNTRKIRRRAEACLVTANGVSQTVSEAAEGWVSGTRSHADAGPFGLSALRPCSFARDLN